MVYLEVKRLVPRLTHPRLLVVHRQLQPPHHVTHRGLGGKRRAPTADHEVVGVVDDMSVQLLLVSQRLPAQDEATHIDIGQQR